MADVEPALIAAFASLTATAVTAYFTWRNHQKQKELELFKTRQQGLLAQQNALTSYEFDARKRLYTACEPVFFQLAEAAEASIRQLRNICSPKFCEQLKPKKENLRSESSAWMLQNSSELIATLYALFAPIALFCILRERLTSVDFSLDDKVWFRYRLARELYESIQDDYGLATCEPTLPYDPRIPDWRTLRLENPRQYWWQGLTRGRLDRAVRTITASEGGSARVLTFGEFEDLYETTYKGEDVKAQKIIGVAANALYGFTPCDRPIFWRLLMVKLHLYNALRKPPPENVRGLLADESSLRRFLMFDNYKPYDWREAGWPAGTAAFDDAPKIALDYLTKRLSVGHR
jgi:hypothetical protein